MTASCGGRAARPAGGVSARPPGAAVRSARPVLWRVRPSGLKAAGPVPLLARGDGRKGDGEEPRRPAPPKRGPDNGRQIAAAGASWSASFERTWCPLKRPRPSTSQDPDPQGPRETRRFAR
jgi:hypothetical protein